MRWGKGERRIIYSETREALDEKITHIEGV